VTPANQFFTSKGLFVYAWDLRDEGVDHVMAWMQDTGLNTMCLASTYHSGWLIHPHNPSHRAYFTEGSRSYFHIDEKLYAKTPLRPRPSDLSRDTNWLSAAAERLDKYKLALVSWTIGVHNTTLGQAFPECTQQNVYGDVLPHALSIGHDSVREYVKALCRDLAVNYPMSGIQLESCGWMSVRHGHHHERDLTGLTVLEQELFSMCFNPETVRKAQAAGIDTEEVREIVRDVLEAAFREAPERPVGHPQTMAEMEAKSPNLKAYNLFRKRLADSLIHEIKTESLRGTACKLFLQTAYDPAIAGACDGFAVWVYGQSPDQVLTTVRAGKARIPPDWTGEYHCYVRLGMGVPSSSGQLRELVMALKEGGATGPVFYNYSESPPKMLGWLKSALKGC
jgi:hypothetical protein